MNLWVAALLKLGQATAAVSFLPRVLPYAQPFLLFVLVRRKIACPIALGVVRAQRLSAEFRFHVVCCLLGVVQNDDKSTSKAIEAARSSAIISAGRADSGYRRLQSGPGSVSCVAVTCCRVLYIAYPAEHCRL